MTPSPRSWGVTGSADWETCAIPDGKRLPLPGELDRLRELAKQSVGCPTRGVYPALGDFAPAMNRQRYLRRVSAELYRLIAQTNIFIEGA